MAAKPTGRRAEHLILIRYTYMPLGIVSEADYIREQSSHTKVPVAQVVDITRGRNRTEAPESLRKIIGEEGIRGEKNEVLTKVFDVSQSSVSSYKNGATSCATYTKPDEDLDKHLQVERDNIGKSARQILIENLAAITPEKIVNAKAQVNSQVAKDMSTIIKNLDPHRDDGVNVQFQFYAPPMKQINEYDIIDVKGN